MPKTDRVALQLICILLLGLSSVVCSETPTPEIRISRQESIPSNATKITPEMDQSPPILHSSEWEDPVPLGGPVNTAGVEDSPFITPDGQSLYFFFTPDGNIPPERQLTDSVTGIYVSTRQAGGWSEPNRVILQDNGEVALDGCEFVQGDLIWFCSARPGNFRDIDLWRASRVDGVWANWENVGEKLNLEYEIGEMHISADGNELYFHSSRDGRSGDIDIWVSTKLGGEWGQPENVSTVNSMEADGWPFISADGSEIWFLRRYLGTPAIFRSVRVNGAWQTPELIISQFSGEPTLDLEGNLYFVHLFYEDGVKLEADIYVAYRR